MAHRRFLRLPKDHGGWKHGTLLGRAGLDVPMRSPVMTALRRATCASLAISVGLWVAGCGQTSPLRAVPLGVRTANHQLSARDVAPDAGSPYYDQIQTLEDFANDDNFHAFVDDNLFIS